MAQQHKNIRDLSAVEIEKVTGADQGVVAGPNGEGCTDRGAKT